MLKGMLSLRPEDISKFCLVQIISFLDPNAIPRRSFFYSQMIGS